MSQYVSAYEQMMQELERKGQVSTWDVKTSYRLQESVNREMETFDIEKQRKAAASEKHAATVVLTA